MIEQTIPQPPLDPPARPYVCDYPNCVEEFFDDPLVSQLDTSLQFCCAECRAEWELDLEEKRRHGGADDSASGR